MASKKKNLNRSTRNTVERPAPLVGAVIRNTVIVLVSALKISKTHLFFLFSTPRSLIIVFSRLGEISSFFNIQSNKREKDIFFVALPLS